jgi:hypothetical protein
MSICSSKKKLSGSITRAMTRTKRKGIKKGKGRGGREGDGMGREEREGHPYFFFYNSVTA